MKGVLVRLEIFLGALVFFDRFVEAMSGLLGSFEFGSRRSGRGGGA